MSPQSSGQEKYHPTTSYPVCSVLSWLGLGSRSLDSRVLIANQPQDHNPRQDAATDELAILHGREAQEILPYEADDSPFPEVRAVVRAVDDVSLPLNTVRMWTIGMIFTIVSGTWAVDRDYA